MFIDRNGETNLTSVMPIFGPRNRQYEPCHRWKMAQSVRRSVQPFVRRFITSASEALASFKYSLT